MKQLLCFLFLIVACGIDAIIDAAYLYITWEDVTALGCMLFFGLIVYTVRNAK